MAHTPEPDASTAALLRAVEIRRVAENSDVLLDDLSVELRRGDRVALAGPSGAGKSLLLRSLVLLDPLDGGRVEWRGAVPRDHKVPGFRRQAVYLAQNPDIEDGPVIRQLERPWRYASAAGDRLDRARAIEMLARTERDAGFLEQMGVNLSGGEAQLVALIRALLLEPYLLLLDEPTAAMDARTRQAAEALLTDWLDSNSERAWVWVSHDPSQLARTCTRHLRLAGGKFQP